MGFDFRAYPLCSLAVFRQISKRTKHLHPDNYGYYRFSHGIVFLTDRHREATVSVTFHCEELLEYGARFRRSNDLKPNAGRHVTRYTNNHAISLRSRGLVKRRTHTVKLHFAQGSSIHNVHEHDREAIIGEIIL